MLVVDDQRINRGLLKCIFEQQYRILEAENGADAFEVLNRESGKVDIILLDLAMPVMDGMEFLKRKQQDAVLAGIPGDYHHSGRHDRTPDPDVAAGSRGLHREAFRAGDCDAQSGKCSGRWQTVETDVCCRRKG